MLPFTIILTPVEACVVKVGHLHVLFTDWFQRDSAQDTVLCHVSGAGSDRRS